MSTVATMTGRPPGRSYYLVLANSNGDPPDECWDGAMEVFGDYTGSAYQSGAAAFTEVPSGSGGSSTYTCVLDDQLPNFPSLPSGVYFWQAFERRGGSPNRVMDAPYRTVGPTEIAVLGTTNAIAQVSLTWDGTYLSPDPVVVRIPAFFVAEVVIADGQLSYQNLGLVATVRTPAYVVPDAEPQLENSDGAIRLLLNTTDLDPGTYIWSVYSSATKEYIVVGKIILEPTVTDP